MELVEAVLQPARHEVPVAAGETQREQRAVGYVEHRIGERHLGGKRFTGGLSTHGVVRDDRQRLQPSGRIEAGGLAVGADNEAAVQRRRDVVGVALQLRSRGQAAGRPARRCGRPPSAPRRSPRAFAHAAGKRDVGLDAEGEAIRWVQALEGRARKRFSRPLGSGSSVSTAKLPVSSTSSVTCSAERRRHAVEAGSQVGRRGRRAHHAAADHRPLRALEERGAVFRAPHTTSQNEG